MTTARELIEDAYRDIGVIGQGKTMSAYLGQRGLVKLNRMLGMWSTEHFLIPSRTSEDLTITSSANSYTIGPGGDFTNTRPEEIVDGYIRAGGIDYSLEIFTMGEYNDISFKPQGYIPSQLWYEPSYPLGVIYLDCQPAFGHILHIDSYKPLTSLATLATAVSLPAGYEETIEYNLALRLAPANGKTPSRDIIELAKDGMDNLKRVRSAQRVPVSTLPRQIRGRGRHNFISDYFK